MTLKDPEVNGVVTTGIYCRAGCVARPKPSNTVRYASHLAAEAAGFRPCLRCRPDRRPPVPINQDTPAAVAQSLMMITDGFLDRHTEAALGQSVGMSIRHLRRLFLEHIGATPVAVAQSRRAHFARRLLDETDLLIGDIAAAAGFHNVRQMNRAMMEVFRFTPGELRARRRDTGRLIIDGGLRLQAPYTPPFDFMAMLSYLAPRAIPGVEAVANGTYMRVISSCGYPGVIEVSQADDGHHLEIVAHLPTFDNLIDDVARCRRLFGLDIDLAGARQALSQDPHIAPLADAKPGLTVPGAWDRFETAVRVIVGQQVSVRTASEITGRIARVFGTPVQGLEGFGLSCLFPPAGKLAEADLSSVGLTAARAATVRSFAQAVASGSLDLYRYKDLPALLERLQLLPGIGPWTANMIAMRVYGHLDAFAESDLGLLRAARRLPGMEDAGAKSLVAAANAWKPWRALAAMYLWTAPS